MTSRQMRLTIRAMERLERALEARARSDYMLDALADFVAWCRVLVQTRLACWEDGRKRDRA